jgi:hypothetical protein
MGGYGSGQRYSGRDTTDDHHNIDVRSLKRGGWLSPGTSSTMRWTRHGQQRAAIGLKAHYGCLTLKYRNQRHGEDWESLEYDIEIVTTPCNYGGERVWFRCPGRGCGRRVAILYISRYFVCRHCLYLAYESQTETARQRADRRAWAIREECGDWGCLLDPLFRRKGMHHQTFWRLSGEYEQACNASAFAFCARMGMSIDEVLR